MTRIGSYMVKAARISGWGLLILTVLYLASGFSLCGEIGFDRLFAPRKALRIHRAMTWPFVVLFLIHVLSSVYLAMQRWGWIKTRAKR